MNTLRALSLTLATIAALSLAFGSVGFTSASLERGVAVDVVSDDEAFVGYDSPEKIDEGEVDGKVDLVTVTNRLGQNVTVDKVEISTENEQGTFKSDISKPEEIGSGENGTITGVIKECEGDPTVYVTVSVSGTGVYATIFGDTDTRKIEVECASQGPEGIESVTFNGKGNVEVSPSVGKTNITTWRIESATTGKGPWNMSGETLSKETDFEFDTSKKLGANPNNADNGVVAIYFEEYDETYYHPEFHPSNKTLPNWGAGEGDYEEGSPSFE